LTTAFACASRNTLFAPGLRRAAAAAGDRLADLRAGRAGGQ
jgi:hypothetical protein